MWRYMILYHVQKFSKEDGGSHRDLVVTAGDDLHQALVKQTQLPYGFH